MRLPCCVRLSSISPESCLNEAPTGFEEANIIDGTAAEERLRIGQELPRAFRALIAAPSTTYGGETAGLDPSSIPLDSTPCSTGMEY